MQEKNKLYKAYLKSKDLGALEKYKKYKNKLIAILHKCEKMYYTNLLEQHKSNLRETWKIIKELLHRQDSNHNVIPLVINGVTIDDPLMIANNFNNYFPSIGLVIWQIIFRQLTVISQITNKNLVFILCLFHLLLKMKVQIYLILKPKKTMLFKMGLNSHSAYIKT